MKKTVLLDGMWDVTGYSPEGETLTLKGTVPGMIHVDLEREGKIPPMFWRDNAEKCQWVEQWTWEYSTSFTLDAEQNLSDSVFMFEGLDTYACIIVNGIHLASTENAQVPFEFDAEKVLQKGYNSLRIIFTPFQRHQVGVRTNYPMAFANDRALVRRIQCTFYWDWVGRFVSFGPWRSVKLHFYDKARIASVYVTTRDIAPTSASLLLRLESERLSAIGEGYPYANITIFDPNGKSIWVKKKMCLYKSKINLQIDVANPKLWWPHHYGEQPLYQYAVELCDEDGKVLDTCNGKFGIRTVRIEQLQDQPGSSEAEKSREMLGVYPPEFQNEKNIPGSSFTVLVNGVRILCKGSNWVPADPFPSRITYEKYEQLLRLAAKGNQNILRVWGGGIYENDCFYELCDELGILIQQDFMLACGAYPEDNDGWMKNYEDEIRKAIKRLRNHPSLAWYSGDNENVTFFDYDDPKAYEIKIVDTIYEPSLQELDPFRPFFPSSPWGGSTNECPVIGDCHLSYYPIFAKPTEVLPRDRYRHFVRYATESFTMGSPLFSSLRTFLTDEDMMDPDRVILEYHLKDNPTNGEGKTILERSRIASDWMLGVPSNLTERVLHDAYHQYYWTNEALSAVRRQRWYCSGIQFWMFNDCWPSAGWSLLDYDLIPKAGWYGVKNASAPIAVSITEEEKEYLIWILNDSLRDVRGQVRVSIADFDGPIIQVGCADFVSTNNCAEVLLRLNKDSLPAPLDDHNQLIAEISGEFEPMRTFFFHTWPKHMCLPKAKYAYTVDKKASTITFTSETYVRAISIDIHGFCDDNYFDMLPGETKVVHVDCYGEHTLDEVEIYCLNP